MDRKNKVMAAAALGAVAILVISSAVRCSTARSAPEGTGTPALQERAASQEETREGSGSEPADTAPSSQESTVDTLKGKAWEADSGATVAFRDGLYVESDGTTARITAFAIDSEEAKDGQVTLMLELFRDGSADAVSSVLVMRTGDDGLLTVASDQFQMARSYKETAGARAAFAVEGVNDGYRELVGKDEAGLASALSAYTAAHVPSASKASFDGEVYVDYNAKTVLATFTCDDAARTILTVAYADAAFTVTG